MGSRHVAVADRLFPRRMLRASRAMLCVASARKGNVWLVMCELSGELGWLPGNADAVATLATGAPLFGAAA